MEHNNEVETIQEASSVAKPANVEMILECPCGVQEIVSVKKANTLLKCRHCGAVNQIPSPDEFSKYWDELHRAHNAFVDEDSIPDFSFEMLRLQAQRIRYAFIKKHICSNCMKRYDGFYATEISGFCPDCIDHVRKQFKTEKPPTECAVIEEPVHTSSHPMDDTATAQWTYSLIGVVAGFLLGGFAAFSTTWLN